MKFSTRHLPAGFYFLLALLLTVITGQCQAQARAFASLDEAAISSLSLNGTAGLTTVNQAPAGMKANIEKPGRPLAETGGGDSNLTTQQIKQAFAQNADIEKSGRPDEKTAVITPAQRTQLQQLAPSSEEGGAHVRFNGRNGTPAFIKIKAPAAPPYALITKDAKTQADFPGIAHRFLADNRDLLKLDDPFEEMKLVSKQQDAGGRWHLRFQQTYKGVPLWGKEMTVHLDNQAVVYLANGRYEPSLKEFDTTPLITPEEALDAVKKARWGNGLEASSNELVIYAEGKSPRLSYQLDVRHGFAERWLYFIDAYTGEVVHRINNIHTGAVVSSSGQDELNGTARNFNTWLEGSTYYLLDPTLQMPGLDTSTYDPLSGLSPSGDTVILDARNTGDLTTSPEKIYFVTNDQTNSGWDPIAVSAIYNTKTVYEYYFNTFGHKGLDNNNKNIIAVIHYGENIDNAFWNGNEMVYGDGGQRFSSLVKCLDIAAHEMTHGVIENTANLRSENQSGALNESFADVFAAMVDSDDWLIGEDCTLADPGHLRNLQNPADGRKPQPTGMSEYQNLPNTRDGDRGGVHTNSGIPNRAAYLTAESLGREKTEKIYYQALTNYLTASAQFIDARRALIQATEDFHGAGSSEVAAVEVAWDTVEVTEGGQGESKPTPTDPVSGNDTMIFLFPEDGSLNDTSENFLIYRQTFPEPFPGYDASQEAGPLNTGANSAFAAYTRPAAFTLSSGTIIFYVGTDNNLYDVRPDGENKKITSTGGVSSIAIAPNGKSFAYTSTKPSDNVIYVVDLDGDDNKNHTIELPDYQEGESASAGIVRRIDSLSYDYTSGTVVFDMRICLSQPDNECRDDDVNSGYNYWSIGFLNIKDGKQTYPFPSQSPNISVGNPVFAANNNFVIALDHVERDSAGNSHSRVVTIDAEAQTLSLVADLGTSTRWFIGTPGFWGEDDFIITRFPTGDTSVASAQRVPLGTSRSPWEGATGIQRINNGAIGRPLMHRAGERNIDAAVEASTDLLDFGDVNTGDTELKSVTLSNTGNTDVDITDISLSNNAFSHTATNGPLPRGESMEISVRFSPADVTGTQADTLAITASDGNDTLPAISVSLTGTSDGSGSNSGDGGNEGKDGGGGGALNPLGLLFMLGVFGWLRFRFAGKSHSRCGYDKLSITNCL